MNIDLKRKISENKLTLGVWSTVGHVQVVEAMLEDGAFDWLAVDLEHSEIGFEKLVQIINVCEKYKVATLVRLSSHNPIEGRKALDLGASGLIIPAVESAVQLSQLCKFFFYPPEGERGVCISRMNGWGDDFDPYLNGFVPVIIPIIESVQGAKNVSEIANLPIVDAVFIGPYDLSASLGKPGDFESEIFKTQLEQIKKTILGAKKPVGIHVVTPSREMLKQRIAESFKFIAFGTDMVFVKNSAKAAEGFNES